MKFTMAPPTRALRLPFRCEDKEIVNNSRNNYIEFCANFYFINCVLSLKAIPLQWIYSNINGKWAKRKVSTGVIHSPISSQSMAKVWTTVSENHIL